MQRILKLSFFSFFIWCLAGAASAEEAAYAPFPAEAPAVAVPAAPLTAPSATDAMLDSAAQAQETAVAAPEQPPSVLDAVLRGKTLLAPVLADFKKKEPGVKPLSSKTGLTSAALAIWNRKDDSVKVVGGTRGAKFFTPDDGSPAIPIVTQAGSQTAYRDSDPDTVVVGTVQASMTQVTVNKKKAYKPSFSYYVPYNKELYSVETLSAGSDYLSSLIAEAFAELDARKVVSRSFPGQPLTSVVDPYLIKSIAVIEHADGQIYEDDNSEEALGRFLVKLALNRGDALDNAVSSAGARGMAQFIPSTYKLMVTKRPDLALIPDFVKGMADHLNAIKAEAAYLDMILADLPQEIRDKYVIDRGSAASYIAAGYNGGSSRVKKAIKAWGEAWSVSHAKDHSALTNKAASLKTRIGQIDKKLKGALTASEKKALTAERAKAVSDRNAALSKAANIKNTWIVAETAGYVIKLRRVYGMLAAGFFATPSAPSNALPVNVAVAPVSAPTALAMGTAPAATNP
jgi:hypothetical protein